MNQTLLLSNNHTIIRTLPIQYQGIHYLDRQWILVVDQMDRFAQDQVKKVAMPPDSQLNTLDFYF